MLLPLLPPVRALALVNCRSNAFNTTSLLVLTNRQLLFLRSDAQYDALLRAASIQSRQALDLLKSFAVREAVPLPAVSVHESASLPAVNAREDTPLPATNSPVATNSPAVCAYSRCLWLSERLVVLACSQQDEDSRVVVMDLVSKRTLCLPLNACALCFVSEEEFCCESRRGEMVLVHVEIDDEDEALCKCDAVL